VLNKKEYTQRSRTSLPESGNGGEGIPAQDLLAELVIQVVDVDCLIRQGNLPPAPVWRTPIPLHRRLSLLPPLRFLWEKEFFLSFFLLKNGVRLRHNFARDCKSVFVRILQLREEIQSEMVRGLETRHDSNAVPCFIWGLDQR
jgi:hypothetical protein